MKTLLGPWTRDTDDGAALPDSRPGLAWLVRLRWLAVLGQLAATWVATEVIPNELALGWVLGLVGFTAASNLVLVLLRRRGVVRRPRALVAAVLVVDTATLTGVLAASAGPMNPFTVFFIVQVALAGLLLGAVGAWSMAVLTSLGFGLLFVIGPEDPHAHHHGASPMHLQGMWIAYTLAAGLVATFVSGIATALRRRDRELGRARERGLEAERLAALSAFSASAAHELGTPLGTIALVATELATRLEREVTTAAERAQLADDARLVRREVERCKVLLRDLAERSGTWAGEAPERLTVAAIVADVRERLPLVGAARLVVAVAPEAAALAACLPPRSLGESLANLVRNALEASPDEVRLEVEARDGRLVFRVADGGPGFRADVLARLGEPFVTTKAPGLGLGLGLHLVMAFADKTGGTFGVARRGARTEVELAVPAQSEATP